VRLFSLLEKLKLLDIAVNVGMDIDKCSKRENSIVFANYQLLEPSTLDRLQCLVPSVTGACTVGPSSKKPGSAPNQRKYEVVKSCRHNFAPRIGVDVVAPSSPMSSISPYSGKTYCSLYISLRLRAHPFLIDRTS
jgi:hypothetical protein